MSGALHDRIHWMFVLPVATLSMSDARNSWEPCISREAGAPRAEHPCRSIVGPYIIASGDSNQAFEIGNSALPVSSFSHLSKSSTASSKALHSLSPSSRRWAISAFCPPANVVVSNSWPSIRVENDEIIIDRGEEYPLVLECLAALHKHRVVRDFDWLVWQARAVRFYDDPLLTFHARKQRFVDGHFASMVQAGHISAILYRLGKLHRTCYDD